MIQLLSNYHRKITRGFDKCAHPKLFIIVKFWRQPKYRKLQEWLDKVYYTQMMECYKAI